MALLEKIYTRRHPPVNQAKSTVASVFEIKFRADLCECAANQTVHQEALVVRVGKAPVTGYKRSTADVRRWDFRGDLTSLDGQTRT